VKSLPVFRLSIVITALGNPPRLDDTLLSVLENRPADCEVVVVHNEPYADPYALSDEVRFVQARGGAGRSECINAGLAAARAPVVHVLACGVEVCPGWTDVPLLHFRDPTVAAVAVVILDRNGRRRIISTGWRYCVGGAAWRSELIPKTAARLGSETLGVEEGTSKRAAECIRHKGTECLSDICSPDMVAAFYRKSALQTVGGPSPKTGDMFAAVDLGLALRYAGFRCVLEPQSVATVDAADCVHPAFRTGRDAERLFWRWAAHHGWLPALAGHACLLTGECLLALWRPSMFVRLTGRICGALQATFARQRPQQREALEAGMPSIIPAPHFAAKSLRDQPQSRVA
jgi:GT2 family glycosyltransferase